MTKKDALTVARDALVNATSTDAIEAVVILNKMIESLSTTRTLSDEAKAALSAQRKAKTASARAELVAQVAPIIRNALTVEPQTAKEIFANCVGLPEGFTVAKVQNVLLRELASEVKRVEAKGKANTYSL